MTLHRAGLLWQPAPGMVPATLSVAGLALWDQDREAAQTVDMTHPLFKACGSAGRRGPLLPRDSTEMAGVLTLQEPKRPGDWSLPKRISWTCPRCGSAWLTPELLPRCSTCGFRDTIS